MIVPTDKPLSPNLGAADAARQQKEKKAQAPCIQEAVMTIVDAAFKKLQADQQAKDKAAEIEANAFLEKACKEIVPGADIESIFNKYKFTREKDCYEFLKNSFGKIYVPHLFIKKCQRLIKSVPWCVQLAKLLATRSTFRFSSDYLDELRLPKEYRVEVIKSAAKTFPFHVCRDIKDAKIDSEQSRIEIAEIAAASDGLCVAECILNYQINNINALRKIMYICIRQNPAEIKKIALSIFKRFGNEELPTYDILRESIEKVPHQIAKKQLLDWLKFYASISKAANLSEEQLKACLPYAQQIMKLQVPDIRFLLADILVMNQIPPGPIHAENSTLLFHIILHALKRTVPLTNKEWEQIAVSLSSKVYFDSTKKEAALRGLLNLIVCAEALKPQEKADLLKHIFISSAATSQQKEQKEKNDATSKAVVPYIQLQLLEVMISSNSLEGLMIPVDQIKETDAKEAKIRASRLKEPIDLSAALSQAFAEHLGLKKIEDFSIKYDKTIGKARNHLALLAYAIKLRSLSKDERLVAQDVLTQFVTVLLEDTYKQWRYQTPADSHLACVFGDRQKLFEQWQQGEQLAIEELLKSEKIPVAVVPQEFDVRKYLHQRICRDKHLNPKDYPNLAKCLENPAACEAVLKELGPELSTLKQGQKFDLKKLSMFRLKLEAALIGLLNPTESPQKKAGKIQKLPFLREICEKDIQFIQDVEDLQKQLESHLLAFDSVKYTIADTDHWEDLLLIGTEVAGSCQHIGGDIKLNKCLLGYIADGKNRAIVIKDEQGKIVARRIMRILWDATLRKPVIYKEGLYHNPGVSHEALDAIDKMFIRRAKALNLTLVHTKEGKLNTALYPNSLQSLSSLSPFEYVDADFNRYADADPGITDGVYEIGAKSIAIVNTDAG